MALNRIREVAENKGIKELSPSQQILESLQIHIHTWNKWWEKKKDPVLWQLPIIADFLNCSIEDLVEVPEKIK